MILTNEEAAYLAGFIDGEGCIHTNRHSKAIPTIMINIVNTDKETLQWIANLLGCKVYPKARGKVGWKPSYVVHIGTKKCREVLPQLIPYLRVKRQHAAIALAILLLPYGSGKKKTELADFLSVLNRRGV